ncbi:MAG TPA: NarL family transcriptional regulator, partial [Chitinophagaceae bacterium]|nr:NarL family transcriptional regulator [Chitinophagaceae bacterium]
MSEFPYVPYGTTVHGQEEIDAVVHVLRTTTQMSTHVRELESKVAALYDKKYGIGVNSGSSALYLAADL